MSLFNMLCLLSYSFPVEDAENVKANEQVPFTKWNPTYHHTQISMPAECSFSQNDSFP